MKKTLLFVLLAAVAFSAEGYKVLNKIKVGGTGGWDYLNVDPATQRVYASHGGIVEVVDLKAGKVVGQVTQLHGVHGIAVASNAKNNELLATFRVGEKPENCAVEGAGKLYANIENSSEVVEIDAAKPAVTRRASLAPCEGPSGLAIDVKNKKLFSVCSNKMMAVTDIATMKVIATPAIGSGADGAGFDSGLAFSSNGDGTMTIVKAVNGKYEAVD